MAAVLTCLFVLLTYLSPAEVLPSIAPLRIELWIGCLAMLTGVASISQRTGIMRVPQLYLMLGLCGAVVFSRLANLFLGASADALLGFMPNLVTFCMVLFAMNTPRKLRALSTVFVVVALYLTVLGAFEYFTDPLHSTFVLAQQTLDASGYPEWSLRVRSTGFLNDPNDFAQFLLVAIALLATNWREGGAKRILTAIIPGLVLVGGIALTKSRSGFLGLLTVLLLALSDRFGKAKAGVLAALGGALLLAGRFTGGREISMEAGVDRLNIWRNGFGLFKHSPVWGIGYGWFQKYADRMTAHNSFILCFTELGLLGYFFWVSLIIFSYYQLNAVRRIVPETQQEADALSMAVSVRLAISAFLVTGWFLSRTYTLTFYILIAMAGALSVMVAGHKPVKMMASPKLAWFRNTLLVEFGSVVMVYILLKVRMLAL